MEDYSREEEEVCPQLLDLIPKGREWARKWAEERSHEISELELRLGPPGGEWAIYREKERERLLSLGPSPHNTVLQPPSPWKHPSSYLHLQSVSKESSQPCSNRAAEQSAAAQNKAFSAANTAVHNSSSTAQKSRTAPASVVGWPPIRSFRKNIASGTSSKPASDSADVAAPTKVSTSAAAEKCSRTPFVKINMDGIPIGRKVDLKAHSSYEKLSLAVDELFRGLLAAQKKACSGGIKDEGEKIGGLLDGSGEYTLVYEDHEGDRMLVGDVPWQ